MKKAWNLLVIICIITLFVICVAVKSNVETKQTEPEVNIIPGGGIVSINGKPKYFDPSGLVNPDLFMSPSYRNKIKSDLIKAGVILVDYEDSLLYVYDVKKEEPYWRLTESKRIIKYKVENDTLYVSANGKQWEKVKFKVVSDEEHIHEDDPSITVYWTIYLECKWFKGEYDIISVPNA